MPHELGLLGHQAERRHAGLGVDLEQIEAGLAQLVVPAEVGTRRAPAAEQAVGPRRHVQHRRGDVVRDLGRADVLGQAVGIFGVIIVESRLGLQLGHRQRLVAQHRDGQLAALDEGLGEQVSKCCHGPSTSRPIGIAVIAVVGDDRDADRRTFVDRLQRHRAAPSGLPGKGSRSRRPCPPACGCRAGPAPSWSAPCRWR